MHRSTTALGSGMWVEGMAWPLLKLYLLVQIWHSLRGHSWLRRHRGIVEYLLILLDPLETYLAVLSMGGF